MNKSDKKFGNYAFISYKREDENWARWLQRKLERYRLPAVIRTEEPTTPKFIRPVFRDNTDLTGGVLADNLRRELDDSRFLIVICSPAATRSEWVNKEVRTFIDEGKADRIIPFVVAGTPNASDPAQECFPEALRSLPAESELLGINVAEVGRERAFIRLVATMLGVKFDKLWQRHKRRERRRRIIAAAVAGVALLAGLFAYDYNRSTYEYYMDYVDVFGLPRGVAQMSRGQAGERCGTFRFRYVRTPFGEPGAYSWRIEEVDYVNGALRPTDIVNSEWPERAPILKLDYNKETGEVARHTYCDVKGKVKLRQVLSRRDGVAAAVADLIHSREQLGVGYASGLLSKSDKDEAKTSIVRYVYTRDAAGRVIGQTFHANNDSRIDKSRIADADGIFAYRFTLDSLGRRVAVSYRGLNGEPVADKKGVATRRYLYDSFGNLTEVSNFGLDGAPALNGDLWAVSRNDIDGLGRVTAVRFFGTDGKPTANKDEGVAAQLRVLDKHGNVIEATYIDVAGKPCNVRSGYSRHTLKYDSHGNRIEGAVFNADGSPGLTEEGVHRYEYKFDKNDNCTEIRHYGTDGKPTFAKDGASIYRETFDNRGNCTSWAYFGVDGEPVSDVDGVSSGTFAYDERDFRTEASYFGTDGKPVNDKNGVARWTMRYDDRGNAIATAFYDADGKPTPNADGVSGVMMEYDEQGNRISWRGLDADGNPSCDKDGVWNTIRSYDSNGNCVLVKYADADGHPVTSSDGTAGYKMEYDRAGNRTTFINIDTLGRPTCDNTGVAIYRNKYDGRRNRIETACFDVDGTPVVSSDGDHRTVSVYDERGNMVETASYDTDGQLVRQPSGILHAVVGYDGRDRVICVTNYDADGNLTTGLQGSARTENEYDGRDNMVRVSFFGADGKPTIGGEGYAVRVDGFDSCNRCVKSSYYGIDGSPIGLFGEIYSTESAYDRYGHLTAYRHLDKDGNPLTSKAAGYYRNEIGYDNQGHIVDWRAFDTDGKPCLTIYGYSSYTAKYDRFGNQIECDYFGPDGEPMETADGGIAGWKDVYDDRGNVIEGTNYGADGKPMLNTSGWAIQRLKRDRFGKVTEISYFGVDGEPVEPAGFHREVRELDRVGHCTVTRYYDKDGKLLGEFVEVPYVTEVKNIRFAGQVPLNSLVLAYNDWRVGQSKKALEDMTRRDRFKAKTMVIMTPDGETRTVSTDYGLMGVSWHYRLVDKAQALSLMR